MRKIVSIIYAAALPVAIVLPVATALTITVPNAASAFFGEKYNSQPTATVIVDYACYKNLRRQGHSVDSAADNCKRLVPAPNW